MSAASDKPLDEAEGKLTALLGEIRGTPTAERTKLYIAKFCGERPLSVYLRDGKIPAKDRLILANALVEILLKRDYSRLPELPVIESVAVKETSADEAPAATASEADDLPIFTRADVRKIVREELAGVMETIARVLRTT